LDIPFVKQSLTPDDAVGIQDVYLLALFSAVKVYAIVFSVVTVAQCDKIWHVICAHGYCHVLYRLEYLNHLIPFSNRLLSSSDFSHEIHPSLTLTTFHVRQEVVIKLVAIVYV
jgi:hypothetical protein